MPTVLVLLAVVAFLLTIASAVGKCPCWVPLVIVTLVLLIERVPVGK